MRTLGPSSMAAAINRPPIVLYVAIFLAIVISGCTQRDKVALAQEATGGDTNSGQRLITHIAVDLARLFPE